MRSSLLTPGIVLQKGILGGELWEVTQPGRESLSRAPCVLALQRGTYLIGTDPLWASAAFLSRKPSLITLHSFSLVYLSKAPVQRPET